MQTSSSLHSGRSSERQRRATISNSVPLLWKDYNHYIVWKDDVFRQEQDSDDVVYVPGQDVPGRDRVGRSNAREHRSRARRIRRHTRLDRFNQEKRCTQPTLGSNDEKESISRTRTVVSKTKKKQRLAFSQLSVTPDLDMLIDPFASHSIVGDDTHERQATRWILEGFGDPDEWEGEEFADIVDLYHPPAPEPPADDE